MNSYVHQSIQLFMLFFYIYNRCSSAFPPLIIPLYYHYNTIIIPLTIVLSWYLYGILIVFIWYLHRRQKEDTWDVGGKQEGKKNLPTRLTSRERMFYIFGICLNISIPLFFTIGRIFFPHQRLSRQAAALPPPKLCESILPL